MEQLDLLLFTWVNRTATHPWLDIAMPVITSAGLWAALLIPAWLVLMVRSRRRGRLAGITLAAAMLLSDVTASQVLKPWIARPRPCHVLPEVSLRVRCGGRNGMPSNHAANAAACAAVLGAFRPRALWVAAPLAVAVAYSRVYVGVHYPGDAVAGLALGAMWGLVLSWLARRRFPGSHGPGRGQAGAGATRNADHILRPPPL